MTRQFKPGKHSLALIMLITIAVTVVLYSACKKDKASCSDGIQNQGEAGIDCGGPCAACPSCSDGIQNQGETGIDCGGPCASCSGSLTATIDGTPFNAVSVLALSLAPQLTIYATSGTKTLTLVHIGAFAPGTYSLQIFGTSYNSSVPFTACNCTSGSITFTTFNTTTQKIAGIFNFACTDSATAGNHIITNGSFQNITY